jgi:16S rRNA (uracil1498-N3)-methyltransferase
LGELASPPAAVRLYIGPEGDFAPDELALAQEVGIQPITLGPRVLRTETAPIVALSALLYALGELDRPATL